MLSFYTTFLRENRLLRQFPSFFWQYRLMRPFLKKVFPFRFLKPGQKAIQVGCAEWMLDYGVSHVLIASAIVGSKGKVLVVEPDQRNIEKLKNYIKKNKINNIQVLKKAVWKEAGKMKFTFFEDRTSTNVLSAGQQRILAHESTKPEYHERSIFETEIAVDSLDNIIEKENFSPDFINITINGTEFEAIQGLEKTWRQKKNLAVAFPIWGVRDWRESALKYLGGKGYNVVVCDAPYTSRGGAHKAPHPYACAMKKHA